MEFAISFSDPENFPDTIMLPRTLENEVMDTATEAVNYDAMNHADVNRRFADDFFAALAESNDTSSSSLSILDVGTGTAQIPIEICSRQDDLKITGVDLAAHMLQLGMKNVLRAGLANQIRLEQVDAKGLPYADESFDAVISNSIVHHIPEPIHALREMKRVLRPGGLLFVRDLLRPADAATVEHIVAQYAVTADQHQQQMFRASLHAALTLEEIRNLLRQLSLSETWVSQSSDRHWTLLGNIPDE